MFVSLRETKRKNRSFATGYTQMAMAQLFGVGVPGISKHLKNIFAEGELDPDTTISKMETVVNRGIRGEVN